MKHIVRFSAAVLLVGLLLSAGYLTYCRALSGKPILNQKMLTVDIDRIEVGSIGYRRVTGTSETNTIAVHLAPEMNPITVNVSGKYLPPRDSSMPKQSPYKAELQLSGIGVWQRDFTVMDSRQRRRSDQKGIKLGKMEFPSFQFHIHTFSVGESGNYMLSIVPMQQVPDLLVTDMSVELRRNVLEANRSIVFTGAALAILGLIGVVVPSVIASKQRKTDAKGQQ